MVYSVFYLPNRRAWMKFIVEPHDANLLVPCWTVASPSSLTSNVIVEEASIRVNTTDRTRVLTSPYVRCDQGIVSAATCTKKFHRCVSHPNGYKTDKEKVRCCDIIDTPYLKLDGCTSTTFTQDIPHLLLQILLPTMKYILQSDFAQRL